MVAIVSDSWPQILSVSLSVVMFMIYRPTKFYLSISSFSLVFAVKVGAKIFHNTTSLLHILVNY